MNPKQRLSANLATLVAALQISLWPVLSSAREMPFQSPVVAGSGSTLADLVAADFDGDGDLDLATKSESADEIY